LPRRDRGNDARETEWPEEWAGITPITAAQGCGPDLPVDSTEEIEAVIAGHVKALSSGDDEARRLSIDVLVDVYLERRALRILFNQGLANDAELRKARDDDA
jgi:hypothetical protein